jgi:hypothetical protein
MKRRVMYTARRVRPVYPACEPLRSEYPVACSRCFAYIHCTDTAYSTINSVLLDHFESNAMRLVFLCITSFMFSFLSDIKFAERFVSNIFVPMNFAQDAWINIRRSSCCVPYCCPILIEIGMCPKIFVKLPKCKTLK